MRCFADAQHDGQTRSLRAFCLAAPRYDYFIDTSRTNNRKPDNFLVLPLNFDLKMKFFAHAQDDTPKFFVDF
jgi:hypothetical protein